jgi:hypothetical protein
VQHDLRRLKGQWEEFQSTRFDAPPILLALEAKLQLPAFETYRRTMRCDAVMDEAIAAFKSEIDSRALAGERIIDSLRADLKSSSLVSEILESVGFGSVRQILTKCQVSVDPPELGDAARNAIAESVKLIRKEWSDQITANRQVVLSIHRFAGQNVIHLGSSLFGSVFITVPHSMRPEEIARALLSEIKKASGQIFSNESTIAIIDGDRQELNYLRIFKNDVVVRSIKPDCERFAANLDAFLKCAPPTAKNTALHYAFPSSDDELGAVFNSDRHGKPDWNVWSDVSPLWKKRATGQGFPSPRSASANDVIDSLTTSKNVIVVVAHSDGETIYMPAPPPEGSRLTAEEVMAKRSEIAANRPVVYLFSCETAEISDMKAFSETLLDAGAAAVIAPQTEIDAERSVDLFEALVRPKSQGRANSLSNFNAAVRSSNYREMEVFLG